MNKERDLQLLLGCKIDFVHNTEYMKTDPVLQILVDELCVLENQYEKRVNAIYVNFLTTEENEE